MRKLFLLLIAEYFLIRMDKKIKADDEKLSSDITDFDKSFHEMSERIKLKRELNGKATKHEVDL